MQKDLFGNDVKITCREYLEQGAIFSPDRRYRYLLYRIWGRGDKTLNSIGLNPSTANEKTDDPTIAKEVAFAKSWGYDCLYKFNLYAFVSSDPKKLLYPNPDPIGIDNDKYLKAIIGDILVCWGSWGKVLDRAYYVKMIIPRPWYCLGKNKDGEPRHPLYLPSDTKLVIYR